jgi:hypothetical protein
VDVEEAEVVVLSEQKIIVVDKLMDVDQDQHLYHQQIHGHLLHHKVLLLDLVHTHHHLLEIKQLGHKQFLLLKVKYLVMLHQQLQEIEVLGNLLPILIFSNTC